MPESKAPVLQPPGAGLPWWERLAAKHIVLPRAWRRVTWVDSARVFQEEGTRALAVWDEIPESRLTERVLIRRFPGIEDSSRFWSAEMTLEHLVIAGTGIRQIVGCLRGGQVPDRPARIQDVKPKGAISPVESRDEFIRFLAETAVEEASLPPIPRGEGPRFIHPWFGPFDAFQWHYLLGHHQGLHRRQLEAIRDGLRSAT